MHCTHSMCVAGRVCVRAWAWWMDRYGVRGHGFASNWKILLDEAVLRTGHTTTILACSEQTPPLPNNRNGRPSDTSRAHNRSYVTFFVFFFIQFFFLLLITWHILTSTARHSNWTYYYNNNNNIVMRLMLLMPYTGIHSYGTTSALPRHVSGCASDVRVCYEHC